MKILLIGSGAREHALARTLANSPTITSLIAAPGNPGIGAVARLVDIKADDVLALAALAQTERVDLVVVGPEAALAAGIADLCAGAGIACFGPRQAAAELESSKPSPRISAAATPSRRPISKCSMTPFRPRCISPDGLRLMSSRPTAWPKAKAW
jgi:phosphoribosylamine---glycine ligase